jgi:predicted secreted protein
MRALRKSILTVGASLVVALGAVATVAAGSASAARVTPPTSTNTVILTNANNGSSVTATKGELVVVHLSSSRIRWPEAQVIESNPVLVFVSGSTSTTGASTTVFRVANYGTAQLTATGYPICAAAKACPAFVILWQATVDVPVQDPPTHV